jgi:hypothetical protein
MKYIKKYKLFESEDFEKEDIKDIFIDLIDLYYIDVDIEDRFIRTSDYEEKTGLNIKIKLNVELVKIADELEYRLKKLKSYLNYRISWLRLLYKNRSHKLSGFFVINEIDNPDYENISIVFKNYNEKVNLIEINFRK